MTIVELRKTQSGPHPQTHNHPGVSAAPAFYGNLSLDQEVVSTGIVPRFPDPAPSTMFRERGRETDSLRAKSSDWSVRKGAAGDRKWGRKP